MALANSQTSESGSRADTTIEIGDRRIPARIAKSLLEQSRGHILRRRQPDYALVFPSTGVEWHCLHMVGVPFALDAVFVRDGEVTAVNRLKPWIGATTGRADTVIELPAGEHDVEVGDTVVVKE